MKIVGWIVVGAGVLWATVGAENILNGVVRGVHFHQWEMASQAIRDNGTFFEIPGLLAAAIGALIVLRANA